MLLALFVFFIAFIAYLKTLAPTIVTEGDSGEFITCIGTRSVPHEPGYASYLLLAAALGKVMPGGLEWGLNLSSALTAALAVSLAALLFFRLAVYLFPAAVGWPLSVVCLAVLAFAFSLNFWEQAIITEVYAPTVALMVLILHLALSLTRHARRRDFLLLSLVLGFGFNIHYLVTLIGTPFWLYFFFRRFLSLKHLLLAACLGLIGFSTNIYMPLAAVGRPPINFGDPSGARAFLSAISRATYRTMNFSRSPGDFLRQIADYLYLMKGQFPWYFFLLTLWGLIVLYLRNRRWALFSGCLYIFFSLGLIGLINYGHMDSSFYQARVFFIPGYLVLSAWLCFSLGDLYERAAGRWGVKAAALALLCLGVLALLHLGSGNRARLDKSRNYISYDYGANMLAALPAESIICTEGDNSLYPLFYFKYLRGIGDKLLVIHQGMFRCSWYMEMLRREYPALVLVPGMTLRQAVSVNSSLAPVYFVNARQVHGLKLRPVNLLFQLDANQAQPPASFFDIYPNWRGLNDEHVPKDWREQSIISGYKEWFLRAGIDAATAGQDEQAERLYLLGLSIRMDVIRYSREVHRLLHLHLARLYGGQERRELSEKHARRSVEIKAMIDPEGP